MSKWRWATWLIVGWTVLMAILCVAVIYPEVPNTPSYDPPPGGSTGAYQAGVAFGASLIYWLFGMLILGPIWYFTRKRVMCPVCGNKVSPNAVMCGRCGFVAGMAYPPQGVYPPQGMYPPQAGWPPQAGQQPPAWPPQPPQAPPPGWPPQAGQQPPAWPPQPPQAPPPGWPPPQAGQQPPAWPPQAGQQPPAWPSQPPQTPPPGWPPAPPPAPPEPPKEG